MAADIASIKGQIAAVKTELTAAVQRVADDVKKLQDQLANGITVNQADLDGIAASLGEITASLKAIDPVPDAPPSPPAP